MAKLFSAKEIANKLKQSEQHVRYLIRKEKLRGTQVGKQWVISQENFDDYIKNSNIVIEPDDHERISENLPDIVALSFFTGAMGLDIGMEMGGIHPLLVCECDKTCRMTIQANRPDLALIGDIREYSSTEILEMAHIPSRRSVDVMFGGPPCQAFSTAGKRKGFDDQRGNVFLRYIDLINEIRPNYFVIENVRGLLSAPYSYPTEGMKAIKGGALMVILDRLRSMGYGISFNLYNAANFGTPQLRERIILIGKRNGGKVPYLIPTHSKGGKFGLNEWRTLSDAFENLKTSEMHHINFPEERLVYYRMLKEGQYWKDLPIDIQKKALGKSYYLGGGKTGFLRRLSFNKPSPTLVTNPTMPATDLAHPTEDRPLSVEEYKCIQEFPDDWIICGTLLEQYKQIGNAVPIRLGKAIAEAIIRDMNNEAFPEHLNNFKYSRYQNTDETSWEANFKSQLPNNVHKQKYIDFE